MFSELFAAAALVGSAPSACPATMVRFGRAKHPTDNAEPWVLGHPQEAGVAAFLLTYRDQRRLVLPTVGTTILWTRSGSGAARRLDSSGSFRFAVTGEAVSELSFPSPGCWLLTIRASTGAASIVARVVRAIDR